MKKWFCKTCGADLFELTKTGSIKFDENGEMKELSDCDESDCVVSCEVCGAEAQGYEREEMEEIAELKEVTE